MDATALLPAAIADYEILHLLGEGPRGRCYLARPPARLGTAEDVVLKVFTRPADEAGFERAVRELRAVAAAGSPWVVRIHEAVLTDGVAYASEHHPLGSLADRGRPLARAEVLTALEHAARAAHALHEAGIAHGGIHPGNVLLVEEAGGTIGGRLADPALSHVLAPGEVLPAGASPDLLEFRDPELLAGARPSRRTEVWSLGATVHRALSGARLHSALPADPPGAIRTLLTTRPQPGPNLEPAEAALVRECLADGPARLRTAAEVADRLATLRSLP